ncbi:Wzz/FepE/Etk N-terminal domain-containing protein [Chelativorans sp. Marseille-P2723]|uniref:GumC family protein n=1 Tax=Chelativorans sp. Marseille-P2723 TaxID=2709133 RepID=UPI00156E98B8|nr:Wzz/FepE/Etk N-terminal domain-containing protein [Chelativorans sp. Marseille-P2723]
MNSGERYAGDVNVDFSRLLAGLKRDWLRLLLAALAITAVVFLLLSLATPLYRSETRVLIETGESVYTRPQVTGAEDRSALDDESVASQVEIVTSTPILAEVAKELDLASKSEFSPRDSVLSRFLVAIGLKSATHVSTEQRVLRTMREKLTVYRVENSRVIVVQFSSEDPELAARIPNAIADAYVAGQREAKLRSNVDATEWLEPEIADLRERVKDAEMRVAEFRASSDLPLAQNNTVLATQQLAEISSEMSRARASRSAAEARAEAVSAALERGVAPETLPDVLASGLIQRLRERQVELRSEIADLSTSLLGNHPRIRALQSQLADLDAQILIEARKVVEALEAEAETARQREAEMSVELERLKAEAARAERQQVELRALEREAAAQRDLLESYLIRYREAAARSERNYLPVDARIFSRATMPAESYFPKVLPITLAAFAASLLMMVILVLLRELFSGRALRPAGMTATGDEGVYATGIHEPSALPVPKVAAVPEPAPAELHSELRPREEVGVQAAAEMLISTGVVRAIFISPEGDEAAATAVLVAREVADTGLRVLLLDLTASGAASLPMLESKSYPGITNLLAAEAQFADVIHADLYSRCHIIPVGTADPEQAMRGFDRMPIIMNSLTIAYDVVVVECGSADAGALKTLSEDDAQLFVSVLEPDEKDVAKITEALKKKGFKEPLLVTPKNYVPPAAPPGRDAA